MTRNSHEVPRVRVLAWPLTLALTFMCDGCDYQVYSTDVGEHVVYHWDADAWAIENTRLCGGTVEAADLFVAGIADYYGWPLGGEGPTIDYFWDRGLVKSACSSHAACVRKSLGRGVVLTYRPLDSHELAHTTSGGHTHSSFINEAFAARWQSGVIGDITFQTSPTFLTEDQLRAQLEFDSSSQVDPFSGFTWWVALETSFGPSKMAEFIAELETASVDDVERALQRVFGISLAESAALAEALPQVALDDPICELDGLPALVWNAGEPLIIERGDVRCGDADVITLEGGRAAWLVALEFPEPAVDVEIRVTVSEGNLIQKDLVLAPCNGELSYDPLSYQRLSAWPASEPGRQSSLGGHYVATLVGVLEIDGSVTFPRAVIQESPP